MMSEVSRDISEHVNVINVFHDINSTSMKNGNQNLLWGNILLKVINVFRGENLTLFTVTTIHSIQKLQKIKTPK